jgi:hypothetical protein
MVVTASAASYAGLTRVSIHLQKMDHRVICAKTRFALLPGDDAAVCDKT